MRVEGLLGDSTQMKILVHKILRRKKILKSIRRIMPTMRKMNTEMTILSKEMKEDPCMLMQPFS